MKITELIKPETIILDLKARDKRAVIDELVEGLDRAGVLKDKTLYLEKILEREDQGSTGIGDSVAIPHAKTTAVNTPTIIFGRSIKGVDYEALDGQPSHLFFMIAATEGANNLHLNALARLSTMLMQESFRNDLLAANTKSDLITLIDQMEQEKFPEENQEKQTETVDSAQPYLLAITACPTGIAHTYMAEDALKQKAKEMGVQIKVETRGSGGAKNVLTKADIERADGVIIAADTNVEKGRFAGKQIISTGVTDGIRKPGELIQTILDGKGKIQEGVARADTNEAPSGNGLGIYKHLMNGVSHMLPFVIGGGILIAIGFLFGIESFDPSSPDYNRFAEALNVIGGGNAFALMIPVLAGFIAMSIADRPGFAPGMVGGFLASQGDSGFLGGLIAGFLAGYVMILLKKGLKSMPQSLDGIKTILLYPLLGIFTTGMIMFFVVEKPVGMFNHLLSDWLTGMGSTNAVILGLVLGGMMAVDMGGPINKAAYTFGLAMIADGVLTPQAAIMVGGMVPPLGIALATTFFASRFTKEERDAGKTNYIMGASFITEGAIPFAAADPGRVIPALVAGSAVAGGLSQLFQIGVPAPHGGIFVIFLVEGNWTLYLLAILIGSLVSALLLGLFKKKV